MKRDPFVYCGGGRPSIHPAWVDSGFSPCFIRTYNALVLFSFAFFICGIAGAVPVKRTFARTAQMAPISGRAGLWLSVTAALVHFVHAVAHTAMAGPVEVVIVTDVLLVLAWLFSILPLLRAQRHRQPLPPVSAAFWTLAWIFVGLEVGSFDSPHWFFRQVSHDRTARLDMALFAFRAAILLALLVITVHAIARRWPSGRRRRRLAANRALNDGEGEALLSESSSEEDMELGGPEPKRAGIQTSKAKSTDAAVATKASDDAAKATGVHRLHRTEGSVTQRHGTTYDNFKMRVKMLWPFIWPKKKPTLQIRVLLCIGLLAAGRVVNLYVPLTYKMVIDKLTPKVSSSQHNVTAPALIDVLWGKQGPRVAFPWQEILFYIGLTFLSGSAGVGMLNNLRSYLWIPVQQYTGFESRVDIFRHLHNLSLRWHLSRKTGEVLRMVDRGTDSISSLLQYILFNIAPTLIDIGIACVYFTTNFGPYFGLIVFITMMLYIYFTIAITEWRTKFRRGTNTRDNKLRQQAIDSLINFETVKYYSGEEFELLRYKERIADYQLYGFRSQASLNLLNTVQNLTIISGMVGGTMLCGYMVSEGELTVGDFVLFIAYIVQLYAPLNYFGTYYRMIQGNLIDMENMLDLIAIEPEIVDAPDAKELAIPKHAHGCSIEFRNVSFSYVPERTILHNVSFKIKAGRTLAIVGSSGSGKSTLMRLLFRFYNPTEGEILVAGQPITKVTQKSLRQAMGVVPQDTVLFNESVRFNIRYGNPSAPIEDVVAAAKGAEIHDSIVSFPDGYDTVVGERGLKLSGGEKQRIAIARAMLKAPQIVMLDEATSALDTQTERQIQRSLERVCYHRTTIVIAHRLSTIVNADRIIVLDAGRIVEEGTHVSLMAAAGRYSDMWYQQQEAEENAHTTGFSDDNDNEDDDAQRPLGAAVGDAEAAAAATAGGSAPAVLPGAVPLPAAPPPSTQGVVSPTQVVTDAAPAPNESRT